jgi:hypothetical protein
MTKPNRTARRADDWTFDMAAGLATHAPTGAVFRMYQHWHAQLDDPLRRMKRWETAQVEGKPWILMGEALLPEGVPDRRPQALVGLGDANAREVRHWLVLADSERLQAALDGLAARHGPEVAKQMVERIAREAGERWIFRARLERGWTDGRRAT